MDEFSFIESIKQPYYKQHSLIKGIGDDAAVFRNPNQDIVTTVDTFVEGVHFSKDTMSLFHVGYRALAANLSDIAAMGAIPSFYLVSIVIPESSGMDELSRLFVGMKELADKYRMDLIGGDTVSGGELSISITVIGYVERDKVRYRSVAKAEDIVFVTGTLGDSQAGFHILTNQGEYKDAAFFIERHRMPTPRVDFARGLTKLPRVALNDISDGIANEANEIAQVSGVAIVINDDLIPTSPSYQQFSSELQYKWKYFGGEDFELVGTVTENDWEEVQQIAKQTNTNVTKIGYVFKQEENGSVFLNRNNKKEKLMKHGYSHLKQVT